jgi:hypothetical protein
MKKNKKKRGKDDEKFETCRQRLLMLKVIGDVMQHLREAYN